MISYVVLAIFDSESSIFFKDMRSSSDSIKHDVKMTKKRWCEELTSFGKNDFADTICN